MVTLKREDLNRNNAPDEAPVNSLVEWLSANITDEMWEAGRSAVMARDCSGKNWSPRQHYEASGESMRGIPDEALAGYHSVIPKEQGAALVFHAMLGQMPDTFGPEPDPDANMGGLQWLADPEAQADLFISVIKHRPGFIFDRRYMTFVFETARQAYQERQQHEVPDEDFSNITPPLPLGEEEA